MSMFVRRQLVTSLIGKQVPIAVRGGSQAGTLRGWSALKDDPHAHFKAHSKGGLTVNQNRKTARTHRQKRFRPALKEKQPLGHLGGLTGIQDGKRWLTMSCLCLSGMKGSRMFNLFDRVSIRSK